MSIVNQVFNSKLLIPQLGNTYVRRERLTDILHNNIQRRLQVISAPAGYGKTTLLADFINSIDVPVCWYSIDVEDEDPKLMLEGILTSLSSYFTSFGKLTVSRLAATDDIRKDAPHLLTIMTNEINDTIPDYFVFVLEDYYRTLRTNEGRIESVARENPRKLPCYHLQSHSGGITGHCQANIEEPGFYT